MTLRLNAFIDLSIEPVRTVQFVRVLWHKAEVDFTTGRRCIKRNKARVTTHELDHSDTVDDTRGFNVGRVNDFGSFLYTGFETERLVDDSDVVVDTLRDTSEGDIHSSFLSHASQFPDSTMSAIATNNVALVDASLLKLVQNLVSGFIVFLGEAAA